MGWAAHGDGCRGFYGESDSALRQRLARAARKRAGDFPKAIHYELFALEAGVSVERTPR